MNQSDETRGAGREARSSEIYLEIAGRGKIEGPLKLPVRIKSLSAGGVILAGAGAPENVLLWVSGGEEAKIRLPYSWDPELTVIEARVQWARPGDDPVSDFQVGVELTDPDLRVRKVLEDHLAAYAQDIKDLWDQWDQLHGGRPWLSAEQGGYYVGVAAMVCGSVLYLAGPESYKLFGTILAFYGCLMMAARSLWAMWQSRTAPKDR